MIQIEKPKKYKHKKLGRTAYEVADGFSIYSDEGEYEYDKEHDILDNMGARSSILNVEEEMLEPLGFEEVEQPIEPVQEEQEKDLRREATERIYQLVWDRAREVGKDDIYQIIKDCMPKVTVGTDTSKALDQLCWDLMNSLTYDKREGREIENDETFAKRKKIFANYGSIGQQFTTAMIPDENSTSGFRMGLVGKSVDTPTPANPFEFTDKSPTKITNHTVVDTPTERIAESEDKPEWYKKTDTIASFVGTIVSHAPEHFYVLGNTVYNLTATPYGEKVWNDKEEKRDIRWDIKPLKPYNKISPIQPKAGNDTDVSEPDMSQDMAEANADMMTAHYMSGGK